jgi:hypothetical protein
VVPLVLVRHAVKFDCQALATFESLVGENYFNEKPIFGKVVDQPSQSPVTPGLR